MSFLGHGLRCRGSRGRKKGRRGIGDRNGEDAGEPCARPKTGLAAIYRGYTGIEFKLEKAGERERPAATTIHYYRYTLLLPPPLLLLLLNRGGGGGGESFALPPPKYPRGQSNRPVTRKWRGWKICRLIERGESSEKSGEGKKGKREGKRGLADTGEAVAITVAKERDIQEAR